MKVGRINNAIKESQHEIKLVYETKKTKNFLQSKDKLSDDESSSIIYKYTCDICQKVYIGASSRHLATRKSEHLKGLANSAIGHHVHLPNKNNFTIITTCPRNLLYLTETLYMHDYSAQNLLNNHGTSYPLKLFDN